DVALGAEELGLAIDACERAVAVDAGDRVREAAVRDRFGESDHDARRHSRCSIGDGSQLLAIRGPSRLAEQPEVVRAEEELREDGDVDLRVSRERLRRPLRVGSRIPYD